jgi:hypothetical protein
VPVWGKWLKYAAGTVYQNTFSQTYRCDMNNINGQRETDLKRIRKLKSLRSLFYVYGIGSMVCEAFKIHRQKKLPMNKM